MSMAPKAKPGPSPKRFQSQLKRRGSGLNWVIVHVPFDAAKVWGLRGQVKVKGEINGFGFRTSLFPTREGRHILLVNKRMQKGAGAAEGSTARFAIVLDVGARTETVPDKMERILKLDGSLRRWC